jgi:hypothetical protein
MVNYLINNYKIINVVAYKRLLFFLCAIVALTLASFCFLRKHRSYFCFAFRSILSANFQLFFLRLIFCCTFWISFRVLF